MGKTSYRTPLNVPGRIGWFTMEIVGPIALWYTMSSLSKQQGITDLPWQNKVLAGLFMLHYSNRAVLYPILQPSMSPIHAIIWIAGVVFQLLNGSSIGCWLGGYGPTTQAEWRAHGFSVLQFAIGLVVFYVGMTCNFFSEEELREIRRNEQKRQARLAGEGKKNIEKHYELPNNFLFKYMLFPHYFMEWVEWSGFWIAAGLGCVPARNFLLNEVVAMFPRTVSGKKWYREKFGEDAVKRKWASIPGIY
jgi:3-oxo-5-alpha-steroid 4-dehydrogenase 1